MTAIDFDTIGEQVPSTRAKRRPRILRLLRVLLRRQRRATRTYLELSGLDERLLYDIGIDPLDVRDALQNRPGPSILMEPMRRQFKHGEHVDE
jgi:uncharacterized protein YjiS (DUF1127 family)